MSGPIEKLEGYLRDKENSENPFFWVIFLAVIAGGLIFHDEVYVGFNKLYDFVLIGLSAAGRVFEGGILGSPDSSMGFFEGIVRIVIALIAFVVLGICALILGFIALVLVLIVGFFQYLQKIYVFPFIAGPFIAKYTYRLAEAGFLAFLRLFAGLFLDLDSVLKKRKKVKPFTGANFRLGRKLFESIKDSVVETASWFYEWLLLIILSYPALVVLSIGLDFFISFASLKPFEINIQKVAWQCFKIWGGGLVIGFVAWFLFDLISEAFTGIREPFEEGVNSMNDKKKKPTEEVQGAIEKISQDKMIITPPEEAPAGLVHSYVGAARLKAKAEFYKTQADVIRGQRNVIQEHTGAFKDAQEYKHAEHDLNQVGDEIKKKQEIKEKEHRFTLKKMDVDDVELDARMAEVRGKIKQMEKSEEAKPPEDRFKSRLYEILKKIKEGEATLKQVYEEIDLDMNIDPEEKTRTKELLKNEWMKMKEEMEL